MLWLAAGLIALSWVCIAAAFVGIRLGWPAGAVLAVWTVAAVAPGAGGCVALAAGS